MRGIPYYRTLALVAMIGIAGISSHTTHAQSEEVRSAREKIDVQIEALEKVQSESTLTSTSEEKKFEAKKKALESVIIFTEAELKTMKSHLATLGEIESEFVVIKEVLLKELELQGEYLASIRARFKKAETIESIEAIALEVQKWRLEKWNPLTESIITLHLLTQNRSALRTVDARFAKLTLYVKRIRAWHARGSELETLIGEAAKDIKEARSLYASARERFLENENDARVPKETEEVMDTTEDNRIETVPGVTEVISDSFEQIREAYLVFLKIAKIASGTVLQ